MDIQIRKINLIQELVTIESENVITLIENIVSKSSNKKLDFQNKKLLEIFESRVKKSLQDIKEGKLTSMEDFDAEIERW